jgi:DUF1009 family protein
VNSPQKVGLIAGWGDFPVTVARRLAAEGAEVYAVGIRGHADPQLATICTRFRWLGATRLGAQLRFFRRHGVRRATMAGKLFKTRMFERLAWLRHLPDATFLRHYYPHFISGAADRNDDALMLRFVELFQSHGIEMMPATDIAPELLVRQGTLTQRPLTRYQLRDVQFAWDLARRMGGLDVGQSVAVKGRAVLAVEAVEGTDECIRRAGQLCPSGGFTVVKVAKPAQDMRFDVPTIGIGTIQTMRDAGGSVLAIEADRTIVLGEPDLIHYANRNGISVVALCESDVQSLRAAAA